MFLSSVMVLIIMLSKATCIYIIMSKFFIIYSPCTLPKALFLIFFFNLIYFQAAIEAKSTIVHELKETPLAPVVQVGIQIFVFYYSTTLVYVHECSGLTFQEE